MPMLEIEVKCPVENIGPVEERLISQGVVSRERCRRRTATSVIPAGILPPPTRGCGCAEREMGWSSITRDPRSTSSPRPGRSLAPPCPIPGPWTSYFSAWDSPLWPRWRRSGDRTAWARWVCPWTRSPGWGFVELEVQDLPLDVGRSMLQEAMKALGLERTERRSYLELLLEKRA